MNTIFKLVGWIGIIAPFTDYLLIIKNPLLFVATTLFLILGGVWLALRESCQKLATQMLADFGIYYPSKTTSTTTTTTLTKEEINQN